jgi:hypothetical protein
MKTYSIFFSLQSDKNISTISTKENNLIYLVIWISIFLDNVKIKEVKNKIKNKQKQKQKPFKYVA